MTWTLIILFMSVDRPSRAVSVATVPGFATQGQCDVAKRAIGDVDDRMGVGCFAQGVEPAPAPQCPPLRWPPFPSCPDAGPCLVSVPVFTLTGAPTKEDHPCRGEGACSGARFTHGRAAWLKFKCFDGGPIICDGAP